MCGFWFGVCIFIMFYNFGVSDTTDYKSYLLELKLYLKEEEIPTLVAESIFGNDATLNRHFKASRISLNDVIEVLQFSNITFRMALENVNINSEKLQLLDKCTEITNSLNKINNFLPNFTGDLSKVAIDVNELKQTLKVLSESRYINTNIEKLLEVVNPDILLSDVLKLLKSVNFDQTFLKLSKTVKRNCDIDLGKLVTVDSAIRLTKVLNLNASDFYKNRAFSDFLKHILDFNNKVVGTAVSEHEIITFIYDDFLKNHTKLVAETFEKQQYEVTKIDYNSNIATLTTTKALQANPIKIPRNIEEINHENCVYLSKTQDNLFYNEMFALKLESNEVLYVNKTNETVFSLGSPLLCGDYLYGVANWEDENRIEFIPVYHEINEYNQIFTALMKILLLLPPLIF